MIPGCGAAPYWADLPGPPTLHLAAWGFAPVKVTADAAELLGEGGKEIVSICYVRSLAISHLKAYLIHCIFVLY